ncbi:TrmJ/YjtD family RNA methyltransferase [Candidatus Woesearchaeota archaeon]|nr:TrmJ/YjtD family RNA methyltransferase [Candidatus Woesearchaeota archaeon]MCF7900860.1 TrmJ/YjtD family RNA methyltransferase [Candidatus Woesearchaeota archaeon]MCF8014024.1 TrmJ/YjtD family RNA methyltransferase [Candidatus Woesearchaeota archaeon]
MGDVYVVLLEPKISGNIGAVARSMANFGFSNLVLVTPKCDVDDEARNRAKHAQKILNKAKIFKSADKIFSKFDTIIGTTGITGTDFNLIRSPLLMGDVAFKILSAKGSVALLFGPEDTGLSNEQLKNCDFVLSIPTHKDYPVMNLSHAVTVLLYELFRHESAQILRDKHKQSAPREKEVLFGVVDDLINQTNFKTEDERTTQKLIWKRFVGKAMLTRRETFGLIGFLKKLVKK